MKKSIETIWNEGFLDEKSLVIPRINNLYNQKSKYLVDRMKSLFKVNLIIIIIMAVALPVLHYFVDALWQGVVASAILLGIAWYSGMQVLSLKTLNLGVNSYEYLKSFNERVKKVVSSTAKIMRFFYPFCFLIAMSTIWSTLKNSEELAVKMAKKFPNLTFIGNVPLVVLVAVGMVTLLMFYFSDKIYRWDLRLMYGSMFDKLEETLADMDELKKE